MIRATDSTFALVVAAAMVIMCVGAGFFAGRFCRPKETECIVALKDQFGNVTYFIGKAL